MTKRQAEVLRFLRAWLASHDHSPTVEEIARGCGLSSRSEVHRLLRCLQREGLVTWTPRAARSLRLVGAAGSQPAFAPPPAVMSAVGRLLGSIKAENPDVDIAVISAYALGELDEAYTAARETA